MKDAIRRKSLLFCLLAVLIAAISVCPTVCSVAFAEEYGNVEIKNLWYYETLDFGYAESAVAQWDKSRLSQKVIAVIDTGIDASHEVFDGVLYTDKDGKPVGYNAQTGREVAATELGDLTENKHGNSIAGVIAMFIKELGLQDYIKIYPIKANSRNAQTGAQTEFINIDFVANGLKKANEIGADVINMSFGKLYSDKGAIWAGEGDNNPLPSAIYNAIENSFIVAAAGNDGKDSASDANVYYPAGIEGIYSVMSLDKNGRIVSNYGSVYDIAAPGDEVYTAYMTEGIKYHFMDGSSLASPIVSFAGALLKLRYEAEGKSALSGKQVANYMRNLDAETVSHKGLNNKVYDIKCLDFRTLLTQDFENTNFNYYPPSDIEIVHDGVLGSGEYSDTIMMHATSVKPVNFTAKINPYGMTDPDIDASIKWVIRKTTVGDDTEKVAITEVGKGIKLAYTPQVFGEYSIVAILEYGDEVFEAEQKVKIEYAPYLVGEVRVTYAANADQSVDSAPSRGILYTTETTVFALTGMKYVDKSVTIKWYVDGVLYAEGETFAYTPKKWGTQRISAQYGDNPMINTTYVFTAEVRPFIARPLDLTMLLLAFALVAAAGGVAIAVVVRKRKARAAQISAEDEINTEE